MYPRSVNGNTPMFWDYDDNCPQVLTSGACRNEGQPNAQAGWGVQHEEGKSRGGQVPGVQSSHRADIEAVRQGLKKAEYWPTSGVTVITGNQKVAREVYREREPGNEDLWKDVDRLRESIKGSSVQYMPDLGGDYKVPNGNAREAAGFSAPKTSSQYGSGARGSSGGSSSNSGQYNQPRGSGSGSGARGSSGPSYDEPQEFYAMGFQAHFK